MLTNLDFDFDQAKSYTTAMRFFNSLILIASIVAPSSVSAQRKCKDSNMPFKYDGDTVTCHDIGDDICEDPVVMSHCPMTCDQCDDYMCVDSEAKMKKGGRKRNGKTFYCSWLDETDDESLEYLCSIKKFQRSCRDACGYCDYTMHFDKIDTFGGIRAVDKFAYKQTDIRLYDAVFADAEVLGYYYEDFPLDELTVSKPNFLASQSNFLGFDCIGGSFSLKSLYLAQLIFGYYSTSIVFGAYNEYGFAGETTIEIDPYTVQFVEFEQGGNFTDVNYVYAYSLNGAVLGMDNVEVHITSPCIPYSEEPDQKSAYYDAAKARLPEGVLSSTESPWFEMEK